MVTQEIVMTRPGDPDVLEVREAEVPAPASGQVTVRIEAAGVAFAEVQMLRERYYDQPKFPFVPGYDLVGTVVDAGAGARFAVGTRVAAMTRTGAWRGAITLADTDLVEVPDGLDAADAVALVTNGVTAWQLLHRVAKVESGDTILVHGAGGGVGMLLSRLAVAAGSTVIGTASAGKHDALRANGIAPVDYRGTDVPAAIRALAPDGVDAVFDHLGGDSVPASYRLLARGGTVVCYGAASTMDNSGHPILPYLRIIARIAGWEARRLTGLGGGRKARLYSIKPGADFRADLARVLALAAAGDLSAPVAARLPLTSAREALQQLVDGKVTGKLVLEPSPGSSR